jgi:C1A family cysteine protease
MNEFNLRRWNPDFRGDLIEFAPVLSPNYLYARERMLDGTALSDDAGSYGRTACRVMQQFGVCPEPDMPYVDGRFSTAPDPSQDEQAATLRLGAYHRLTTVDDMKHCILSDYVFIVGFDVKESFESKTSGTGLYQPSHNEISMGGHEVLFYGYDDNVHGGAFLVRNSWSKDWGRDGDFWYAYSTAADSEITHDAFVQHYGVWK